MSITIHDPALRAKLIDAIVENEKIELTDERGAVLGTFTREGNGKPPPGFKIPFTDAEIEEQSKNRTGRPLKDIMNDLREKYGR